MPITLPTTAQFKARYPEFEDVDDDLVTEVIVEGSRYCDDTWMPADIQPAIMALTAHLLSIEGWPGRISNPGGWSGQTAGRQVISRRVGDVSTTYSNVGAGASGSGTSFWDELSTTSYGRRFLALLRLNAQTISVV